MKTQFVLLAIIAIFSGMITSCSPDDDQIVLPNYEATGDEADDPVEPDRENDLYGLLIF